MWDHIINNTVIYVVLLLKSLWIRCSNGVLENSGQTTVRVTSGKVYEGQWDKKNLACGWPLTTLCPPLVRLGFLCQAWNALNFALIIIFTGFRNHSLYDCSKWGWSTTEASVRTLTYSFIWLGPIVRKTVIKDSLPTIHYCCKQLMNLLLMNVYEIEHDDAVLHYITQTFPH